MATLNVATDFYALQNCSLARFFSLPYQILGKCPPCPAWGAGKNVKAGGFSISVQTFYKQCHSLCSYLKSPQMCCWCLHIKFCILGRSSYCVEVKPWPWKIPPPLEVDSADLAEQIWLKIAGGWKKGLTSFWWALNEALSDSWHVKKMSADLLSIFCRSSLFLRRRPCKNENEQTICVYMKFIVVWGNINVPSSAQIILHSA